MNLCTHTHQILSVQLCDITTSQRVICDILSKKKKFECQTIGIGNFLFDTLFKKTTTTTTTAKAIILLIVFVINCP